MSGEGQSGLRLPLLRQLLAESERDLVALSREEADRIVAIPDRETRLRAYLRLRESWAEGGDRLLPEDEARIQESLAVSALQLEVPAPPPAPRLPLTPLSLLAWAETWRYGLVESALRRGAEGGRGFGLADLEKLLLRGDSQISLAIPEIGVVRQIDAVLSELREGLDSRQLNPSEAIPGQVGNLPALLKSLASARARRQIAVPPVPPNPAQRVSVADLLSWFEALMNFEEAVGARALMQSGIVREPEEARARFLAAARGSVAETDDHAAPQLVSWRRAEGMHRACSAALRGGWLTRERLVTIPSFDADELAQWFGHFAAGLPAVPPPPAPATPHTAYRWWASRRSRVLRATALMLLADGGLRAADDIEPAAMALIESQPSIFPGEWALLRDARNVMAVCEQILRDGRPIPPLQDCTDPVALVRIWSPVPERPVAPPAVAVAAPAVAAPAVAVAAEPVKPAMQAQVPAAPAPAAAAPAAAPAASVPVASVESPAAPAVPAVPAWRRALAALRRLAETVGTATAVAVVSILCVMVYQAAAIGLPALQGGASAAVNEAVLRSARATDWRWLGVGLLMLAAALLVLSDAKLLFAPRRWRLAQFAKLLAATAILVGVWTFEPAPRFVSTGDGFAAWPERIVQPGGVPSSRLNPDEGSWFRRRIVEPLGADDLPPVAAGEPPLVLLREVGFFGRTLGWFLANRPDVEAIAGRPAAEFPAAPTITLRMGSAP